MVAKKKRVAGKRSAKKVDPHHAFIRETLEASPRTKHGLALADEVTRVVPIPMMAGFQRAIVCGAKNQPAGYPLGTTGLITGPPKCGKTLMLFMIGMAFQAAGGLFVYIDAEMALHFPWMWSLGVDPNRFIYYGRDPHDARKDKKAEVKPLTFEGTITWTRNMIKRHIAGVRAGQKLGPLFVGVDSLKRLIPAGFSRKLHAQGTDGDVRKLALGREQATFNTGWNADLIPMIADYNISVLFVQHHSVDQDGPVIRGGWGIQHDANIQMRASYASAVYDLAKTDDTSNQSTGKKHRIVVEKNKIGPQKYGSDSSFEFFMSGGGGMAPIGWDRPRTLLNEAVRRGLVGDVKWDWKYNPTLGSKFTLGGKRCTLKTLFNNPELLAELEEVLRG